MAKKQDKVYCVYMSDNTSFTLGNIKKTTLEGMPVIKGTHINKDSWSGNKNIYLSTHSILGMIEFDSFEDYSSSVKKWEKNQKKKNKK